MRNSLLILGLIILINSNAIAQSYNTLWIPDTLIGTNFNLTIKDTFAQIVNTGNQTITGGINGKFWGPTLIINKGDVVNMNVQNDLNDSTTIHWHGMHLPAVMDGGPHQIIPPGTLWQPYWEVKNQASTLWYHPHLHEMSQEQITKGIGGFIIVRDAAEAANGSTGRQVTILVIGLLVIAIAGAVWLFEAIDEVFQQAREKEDDDNQI